MGISVEDTLKAYGVDPKKYDKAILDALSRTPEIMHLRSPLSEVSFEERQRAAQTVSDENRRRWDKIIKSRKGESTC